MCGCGYMDGTEISEAISAAICISQKQMKPVFYAPDVELPDIVDHLTKKPEKYNGTRNALVEAARLARSSIRPLCECKACVHGALIVPGGFGAAKALLVCKYKYKYTDKCLWRLWSKSRLKRFGALSNIASYKKLFVVLYVSSNIIKLTFR